MNKKRLIFSKKGTAAYISHLDLMRTFQRAFIRAEMPVWHTEGFNPHAYVAIALPMPVAHESDCEILDFGFLDGVEAENVVERMNAALPEGITVTACYGDGRALKHIKYVENEITLEYDRGVPENALSAMRELFSHSGIVVSKKGKKGSVKDVDIAPLIREIGFSEGEGRIHIRAVLEAMDPYLNPVYVTAAIEKYLPEYAPDFATYYRRRVLDANMEEFR